MTTIVIEMKDGVLEGVYSDNDVSLFIIDHDEDDEDDYDEDQDKDENNDEQDVYVEKVSKVKGPFIPTLIKPNIADALPDIGYVPEDLFQRQPETPYF